MDSVTPQYSQKSTLEEIRGNFPPEAGSFYDTFFEEGAKEVNDFLDLSLRNSKIFFDVNSNPIKAEIEHVFPIRTKTFDGRVHGGMIAAAFDIMMGVPLLFAKLLPNNMIAVAKELSEIEIFHPVPTRENIMIEVICEKNEGRKFWMTAVIKQDEKILAKAAGFFLSIPINE